MAIRTCIGSNAHDWTRMRDDLVATLSDRGVLHCAGVASALLDTAGAITEQQRRVTGQDEPDGLGAP